jgi:hypothetical protein
MKEEISANSTIKGKYFAQMKFILILSTIHLVVLFFILGRIRVFKVFIRAKKAKIWKKN